MNKLLILLRSYERGGKEKREYLKIKQRIAYRSQFRIRGTSNWSVPHLKKGKHCAPLQSRRVDYGTSKGRSIPWLMKMYIGFFQAAAHLQPTLGFSVSIRIFFCFVEKKKIFLNFSGLPYFPQDFLFLLNHLEKASSLPAFWLVKKSF